MADEGELIPIEHQSNAGKWILTILAILVVAAFAYAHYMTYTSIQKLTSDLNGSQAQVKELQNRMQTAEEQEETLARQAGMTKKELAQRTAELQSAQKAAEARLEKEQKEQIGQVSGDIAGVKTDVGGVKTDVASQKADLEATKAERINRAYRWRFGSSQAQGRPQLLRIHSAQRRQAADHLDREPAVEEARPQEGQVHHERHGRR